MFKLVVAGGRDFNNYKLLEAKLDQLLKEKLENNSQIEIVSGTARGADTLGERYAKNRGFGIKRFPANWKLFGGQAGPIRNMQMRKYADAVVVFWDGKSRGSKNMIEISKEKDMPVRVIYY